LRLLNFIGLGGIWDAQYFGANNCTLRTIIDPLIQLKAIFLQLFKDGRRGVEKTVHKLISEDTQSHRKSPQLTLPITKSIPGILDHVGPFLIVYVHDLIVIKADSSAIISPNSPTDCLEYSAMGPPYFIVLLKSHIATRFKPGINIYYFLGSLALTMEELHSNFPTLHFQYSGIVGQGTWHWCWILTDKLS